MSRENGANSVNTHNRLLLFDEAAATAHVGSRNGLVWTQAMAPRRKGFPRMIEMAGHGSILQPGTPGPCRSQRKERGREGAKTRGDIG